MSLLSLLRGQDGERAAGDNWDIPWGSPQGGTVNEVTAYNLSGVWACQTLIADSIATMPVDVFRRNGGQREEITKPAWFDYPNPDETKVDYDTQRLLSLLGWGNAYSFLTRRGDSSSLTAPIISRRIIHPAGVDVRRIEGTKRYFVSGVEIPAGNIQHISGYRRPGDLYGMSMIANAAAGLNESQAAQDLARNLYENGLNTSGVISVPEMPADTAETQIARIADRIRQWYGGAKNAGKPLVLTGGTTWEPMSVTPADAQFLETRRFQLEEIARWYRVPLHEIQHMDKQSSWGTGIEQLSVGLVRRTLMPWIVRLEQADSALLPDPQFVKYNIDTQVRADLKTRYEAHELAIRSGMATPNNRRALEDEPPIVGGDAVRIPAGVSLVGRDDVPDATIVNAVGALVRAGFEPASVLSALGLPKIDHTGLLPVTVQMEPDPPGLTPPPGGPDGPE